jgi:acyl-CoA dehydrogenase
MGLTPDTPLAYLFTWARALRFIDGPDEVHLRVVAREELRRARARAGSLSAYFTPYCDDGRSQQPGDRQGGRRHEP